MIALFSATGNSGLVARLLSEILGDEITPVLTLDSERAAREERIIWVFPVHGWSCPEVVERHIAGLTLRPGTVHYAVMTCGDDIGRTDRRFDRLLRRCGAEEGLRGAASVLMPDTYVLLPGFDVDGAEEREAKLRAMPGHVREIAGRIASGERFSDVKPGGVPGLKSGLLRWAFRRWLMSPRPFHAVAARCSGCGACVKVCPLGNTSMGADGLPRWGENCATCLACYHRCPRHAIEYGRRTTRKGQYRLDRES